MAGKAKFDQEAAFKSIIGADRRPVEAAGGNRKTEEEQGSCAASLLFRSGH